MIVLDCSAALSMVFEDEGGEMASTLFEHFADDGAIVPQVWPLEVCNALLSASRRGRLAKAEVRHVFSMLSALPVQIIHEATRLEPYARLFEVSAGLELSAYDASYLALAMDRGLPLATLDSGLRQAAEKAGAAVFDDRS